MSTREHQIVLTPLDEVKGWDENPKAHEVYAIRLSYKHHGFVTPPVMDERSGKLVAGHGRIKALREMKDAGEDPPEGVKVAEGGQWLIPVVRGITFDTEESALAYVVVDNQLTIAGLWDDQKLFNLLTQVSDAVPMEMTGFTFDQYEDILAGVGAAKPVVPEEEFKGSYADSPEDLQEREAIQHEPHREVVILLLDSEHEAFAAQVGKLKEAWSLNTLKQVLTRAVDQAVEQLPPTEA